MESTEINVLLNQLTAGFESLQEEYQKLFGQHQALERKLATAREQYNELSKLYDSGNVTTPPLSLSSAHSPKQESGTALTVPQILAQSRSTASKAAAQKVLAGAEAALAFKCGIPHDVSTDGVKIWAGPSADYPDRGSSFMPSISESPLEQDFTIEGKPSSLGCPFASMANKKLSSHAASVLSRYNQGSVGAPSVSSNSVSRVNGRESLARRASQRLSIADPIKADICGLSDHGEPSPPTTGPNDAHFSKDIVVTDEEKAETADAGVCPIRFLDQHSPEEVATYFERHKHELPRSHEICVKRYQSNENQIRELDAKYGNLVSMIQGLGAKHKNMLPEDPDPEEENSNAVDDAKVRQWASSVSRAGVDAVGDDDDNERKPHFERPLREVRVGESPGRPWGISVPPQYYERPASISGDGNVTSAVQTQDPAMNQADSKKPINESNAARPPGKCPFGFDQTGTAPTPKGQAPRHEQIPKASGEAPSQPVFISEMLDTKNANVVDAEKQQHGPRMIFSGPVFIGYSADDAAKILRGSGFGQTSQCLG